MKKGNDKKEQYFLPHEKTSWKLHFFEGNMNMPIIAIAEEAK